MNSSVYADYAEDLKEKTPDADSAVQGDPAPSYVIKPVSKLTVRGYYYSGYSHYKYCFENSEGRCLDKEYNLSTTIEGKGQIDNTFYAYYKTELDEDGILRFKKGYGLLNMGIWTWEAGKDTVWLGPGYHGSFLLSNNAEGFLLVRVRTAEAFRLPWIFSTLGEFKYDLFRGWSDNSGLLGHRLSWRPLPSLEIGANQIAYIPPRRNYEVYEYPHALFSSSDHDGRQNSFDNDQKASIDIALDLPFLSESTPFVDGKMYVEYGGNDSFTAWQSDKNHMRDVWKHTNTKYFQPIPFDFENIAWMAGLFFTTGSMDFRVEYAQNYASYPLFYDFYNHSEDRRHGYWYGDLNTRKGMITGHHMGNDADDLFLETTIRRGPASLRISYDQERHGLSKDVAYPPEYRYQYGMSPSYRFKTVAIFAELIYNHYRNVDANNDPLMLDIHPGARKDEGIGGFGVELYF